MPSVRPPSPASPGRSGSARHFVVIVDNDAVQGESLVQWLKSRGFAAVRTGSLFEARAACEAVDVDVLIGHLALPDGSLFGLVAALAARPAVVVGYADVEIAPPPELDAICVRPIDLPALGAFLHTRLGRHHSGELARVDPNDPEWNRRRTSIPPAARRRDSSLVDASARVGIDAPAKRRPKGARRRR